MQQPWVSIDLSADSTSAKMLATAANPAPCPEVSLLAAQSELRLQLYPALQARHTTETAALYRSHKLDREAMDQRYAEDSRTMEARHIAERSALNDNYRFGREGLEQRFATESCDMQARQLSETQDFLQQNLGLHKDLIAALGQQRKQLQEVSRTSFQLIAMHAPS